MQKRMGLFLVFFAKIDSVNLVIFVFVNDLFEIVNVFVDDVFKDNGFFQFAFLFGKAFGIENTVFFAVVLDGVNKFKFYIVTVFVGEGNGIVFFKILHQNQLSCSSKS